jgi:NAD(P)-dependent dehydrogenase (short-subunit alcohol dehydrogenase family)
MSASKYSGKVAIITAAGAGIGRAIALEWAQGGGTVLAADRDQQAAEEAAQELSSLGVKAIAMQVDVTHLDSIKAMVERAVQELGGIDALFNVAGTNMLKNVEEANDDEWRLIIDTNLTSVYRCSKYVIPELRKRGGGAIVNIASTAGLTAENRCAAYSASKAAVVMLSRNMAMDFAKDGIRVNALCPGGTITPRIQANMAKRSNPEDEESYLSLIPMRRRAEAVEIAKAAVFLASDDASYITGTSLAVDGGFTAGIRFPFFDR